MKTFLLGFSVLMVIALLFPMVFAFEYGDPDIFDDTKFETFGPRCDNLLIKLYASETAEWAALEAGEIDVTDWPLDAAHYTAYQTAPLNESIKVISYGPEFGLFLFDLNNNNNEFLGNPPDPAYPNPVYPNPMSCECLREAVAYLSDRDYVINEVIGEGFAFPVYTPMSPASGFYVHPEIRPGGSLEDLCYLYDPAKAVQVLDDSGKFPIGPDGWRYWDMNLNGVKDAGEELALKLFARTEGAPRLAIGTRLYSLLETNTKIRVNFVTGDRAAALVQVMGNKDFHIYTAGWSLTMDPDHLVLWHWDYYWHPGQCYNTVGANCPTFNDAADGVQYANTIEEATYYAEIAQEIFAENVLSVPLWAAGGNKAVSRTYVGTTLPEAGYTGRWWRNFVNIAGFGVDSYFTFLSMRPTEIAPRAVGGTIRYGFKTNTLNSLNPLYATDSTDNAVLDLVGYESLLYREPYTRMFKPWLADSFVVGTWDNAGDTCTAINFTMRRAAYWSDGTPITFDDIEYTFIQMKLDLAARGLPDPWWISNVQNIVQLVTYSPTQFEIRLDVKSVFAVGWIGGNRIMPKHIWQPICLGAIAPKSGLAWDPTTSAPDANIIHSGAWCFDNYETGTSILLTAHKKGVTVDTGITSDPNMNSNPVTSPYGFFRYYRPEDYNHDDKVNILDAIKLGNYFGAKEGNPDPSKPIYDRLYDINGYGSIDILTAIKLGNVFGWPNNEKTEATPPPPPPPPISDIAKETKSKTVDSVDGNGDGVPDYGWNSKYDISFTDGKLTVWLNIELTGANPGEDLKKIWREGIENMYNKKYDIVDGEYRYPIEFKVNWVTSNPHHTVNVVQGEGNYDMSTWYTICYDWGEDYNDEAAAHEAAHMWGEYDEYLRELFTDTNGNGRYDRELFTDTNGNGKYDPGEPFTDANGNGAYNAEPFTDTNGDGRWSCGALDPNTWLYGTGSIMETLDGSPSSLHYEKMLDWLKAKSGRNLSLDEY